MARRRSLARRYDRLLQGLPIGLPAQGAEMESSWHLYVIRLQLEKLERTHRQVFEGLRSAGIGVNLHYIPVHTQPFYRQRGFAWGDFPEAERYYGEAMSLPLYFGLTESAQDRVVDTLREVLG